MNNNNNKQKRNEKVKNGLKADRKYYYYGKSNHLVKDYFQ